ncbi:MAG: glutamate--tRNA ligase [Holosporales bacterium]|jgi:glutamyl-tRNA synthetase|nr:glutamate--tRNA ligase [Holosporales bacterium]
MFITRFAPSPTGYIHLGNARIAVINWLFAKKAHGKFMLRLDDTDTERSKQEYIDCLYEDLEWLGLHYDIFARQSDRVERYKECQQKLIDLGRLYACYETPEELDLNRKMQQAKKEPPIYNRAALKATNKQIDMWKAEGRRPHWRFRLNDAEVKFHDLLKGVLLFYPSQNLSDPVVIKEDGTFLYTMSSVIDDLDFGITHIIRGEDHVTNTAIQIQLLEALNNSQHVNITFAHLALLFDQSGQPLSKRLGSFCLKNLRHDGIEPMALNCFLASLGSSSQLCITQDMLKLVQHFDLDKIRGGARIEDKTLYSIQRKILHTMSFNCLSRRNITTTVTQQEWEVIREGLDKVSDVTYWIDVLHGEIVQPEFSCEDAAFLRLAANWLINQELNENTWDLFVVYLKNTTHRSGYNLVHPLRLAITGRDNGPEMKRLLPLIDKQLILHRLMIHQTNSFNTKV